MENTVPWNESGMTYSASLIRAIILSTKKNLAYITGSNEWKSDLFHTHIWDCLETLDICMILLFQWI
jgi:hypothetical protein